MKPGTSRHRSLRGAPARPLVAALLLVGALGGCQRRAHPVEVAPAAMARGRELAEAACGGCHLPPAPATLGRQEWSFVLSYMGFFLGQEQQDGPGHYQRRHHDQSVIAALTGKLALLRGLARAPTEPALSEADWEALRSYYLAGAAPDAPPAGPDDPPVAIPLVKREVRHAREGSVVSAVVIDPPRRELLFSQFGGHSGAAGLLGIVSQQGQVHSLVELTGAPVGIDVAGPTDPVAVLTIAGFSPALGRPRPSALTEISRDDLVRAPLLAGLPRSSTARRVDLDDDGRPEIVLAQFGYGLTGSGAVQIRFRPDPATPGVMQTLWEGDPVVDLAVADLAGDPRPEIALLTAGAREQVCLLSGCGAGRPCLTRCVYEQHPAFGFTRLSTRDLDGDGRLDLLVVNGDNSDGGIEGQQRPYHGVRGLRNRADFDFHELFFLPLQGASMAVAEDLDGDGDLDVAAVSAYPTRRLRALRSFVVFEQVARLSFLPRSFAGVEDARWISLAAGDLDGDGDIDLALGGLRAQLGPLPATSGRQRWLRALAPAEGPSLVILRNDSERRAPRVTARGG